MDESRAIVVKLDSHVYDAYRTVLHLGSCSHIDHYTVLFSCPENEEIISLTDLLFTCKRKFTLIEPEAIELHALEYTDYPIIVEPGYYLAKDALVYFEFCYEVAQFIPGITGVSALNTPEEEYVPQPFHIRKRTGKLEGVWAAWTETLNLEEEATYLYPDVPRARGRIEPWIWSEEFNIADPSRTIWTVEEV